MTRNPFLEPLVSQEFYPGIFLQRMSKKSSLEEPCIDVQGETPVGDTSEVADTRNRYLEMLYTILLVAFFMAVGPALMILNKEILDGVCTLHAIKARAFLCTRTRTRI